MGPPIPKDKDPDEAFDELPPEELEKLKERAKKVSNKLPEEFNPDKGYEQWLEAQKAAKNPKGRGK